MGRSLSTTHRKRNLRLPDKARLEGFQKPPEPSSPRSSPDPTMTLPEALEACRARLRKSAHWLIVLALPALLAPALFFSFREISLRSTLQFLSLQTVWTLGVFLAALPWQWHAKGRPWRAWVRGTLQSLILVAALATLAGLLLAVLSSKSEAFSTRWAAFGAGLMVPFLMFLIPVGLVGARIERMDAEAQAARAKAREAQWMSHRGAFSPHLLFRNLNYLADMAPGETRLTEKGLLDLAALYRQWLIEAEKPLIPFSAEQEITESYLALERRQWGERLRIRWILDPALDDRPVPPLLFLPLLESVLSDSQDGGALSLEFRATPEGSDLVLGLQVRGRVAPPGEQPLAQIRQRLRAVFDQGGEVSVEAAPEGWDARVRVPSLNPGAHS